jgi:FkbM family methyltransferase
MNMAQPPMYQLALQKLPLIRREALRVVGLVLPGGLPAVVNGMKMRLDVREGIQASMFLGEYEPTQTGWFRECLGPGHVVIDVGASFGHYTTLASTLVGETGRVFAFEPSPVAGERLRSAIQAAGVRNVLVTQAAVGRAEQNVTLYLPTNTDLHSPSLLASDPDFTPHSVPSLVLDRFAPLLEMPRVRLVKIDVEGYEPNVLDSMDGLIRAGRIENIICEFNSWWLRKNSTTPSQLEQRLIDSGYRVRARTILKTDLVGRHGELFDLQDIWFTRG